jgi:CheY-like chemotaxis protein
MYAEMGEDMLTQLGYEVTMKTKSREALESFKSTPENYDLVITDQIMPNLSGDELAKEIRLIKPEIPIILSTGYSSQMDEKKAQSLGINAFAYKPIVKKDIAKLIRKVLDG